MFGKVGVGVRLCFETRGLKMFEQDEFSWS